MLKMSFKLYKYGGQVTDDLIGLQFYMNYDSCSYMIISTYKNNIFNISLFVLYILFQFCEGSCIAVGHVSETSPQKGGAKDTLL